MQLICELVDLLFPPSHIFLVGSLHFIDDLDSEHVLIQVWNDFDLYFFKLMLFLFYQFFEFGNFVLEFSLDLSVFCCQRLAMSL